MRHLPDASKLELAKALKIVGAASRRWQRCLVVELESIGRYSDAAVNAVEEDYQAALAEVAAITGDEVPPAGLFSSSGYAQEAER